MCRDISLLLICTQVFSTVEVKDLLLDILPILVQAHIVKPAKIPASILYKSIAGRYRPVRVADGPITVRYRFIKNAYWDVCISMFSQTELWTN